MSGFQWCKHAWWAGAGRAVVKESASVSVKRKREKGKTDGQPLSLEPQACYGGVARETETHVHGYTVTQSEAQRGAASAIEK